MDPRLDALIQRFNEAQRHVAAVLRDRLGIALPATNSAWVGQHEDVWRRAKAVGLFIRPHGYGLAFRDALLWIDFDFGEHGEIDGFNVSRLFAFDQQNALGSGFADEREVRSAIEAAVAAGELRRSDYINIYHCHRRDEG